MFNKSSLNFIILFLTSCLINGQQKALEITYKRNNDKSIDFYYNKTSPGSTYIIINFKRFDNARGRSVVRKNVRGYSGSLLKLEPIDDTNGIGFSFTYTHLVGNSNAKVNKDFNYVLPFKNGKEIHAFDLNYLGKRFGNKAPKNWKSIQFLTKPNDTVFAARKGIVVEIKDAFAKDDQSEYSFKNKANYIIIEHEDGTLAKYGVLKKNSILVKLGDKVYPSIPIALAGTYDKPENSQLRLSIYYLDKKEANSKKIGEKQTLSNQKHLYAYINPFFYTNNSTTQLNSGEKYITICNDDIIKFEMSKREKKKWLKTKSE